MDASQQNEPKCAKCQQPMEGDTAVQTLVGKFHRICLFCDICKNTRCPNLFVYRNLLLCPADYAKFCKTCPKCKQIIQKDESYVRYQNYNYHSSCFKCDTCKALLKPGEKFHQNETGVISCETHYFKNMIEGLSTNQNKSDGDDAAKVKRTTFSDDQLRMLREMFQQCDKPTAYQLDMLSMMTKLKRRTVQVWFQNQRAKLRRRGNSQQTNTT